MGRFLYIVQVICFGVFSLVLMVKIMSVITDSGLFDEEQHLKKQTEEFEQFKKDTEVIKGKVVNAETHSRWYTTTKYNLIVKSDSGETKMLKVNEQQYRDYQDGSNVKFRMKPSMQNEVIIDLKKQKDINNVKEYMKFNNSEFKYSNTETERNK